MSICRCARARTRSTRSAAPSGGPACGPGEAPLWSAALREQLAYAPLLLTGSGLAGSQPDWGEVQDGQHRPASLPRDAPALVLWVEGFALRAGDRLDYRITAPDGSAFFSDSRTEAKSQARFFRYVGKRRPEAGWPAGIWRSEVTLSRTGQAPVQPGPRGRAALNATQTS